MVGCKDYHCVKSAIPMILGYHSLQKFCICLYSMWALFNSAQYIVLPVMLLLLTFFIWDQFVSNFYVHSRTGCDVELYNLEGTVGFLLQQPFPSQNSHMKYIRHVMNQTVVYSKYMFCFK